MKDFFLLYVRRGKEIDLADKYSAFCPIREFLKYPKRRKSRKPVKVKVAAYPSYIFIPCDDYMNVLSSLKDQDVYYIVRLSENYSVINERELIGKEQLEEQKVGYSIGDEVVINIGESQIKGTYSEGNKVELFLFGRKISISLP